MPAKRVSKSAGTSAVEGDTFEAVDANEVAARRVAYQILEALESIVIPSEQTRAILNSSHGFATAYGSARLVPCAMERRSRRRRDNYGVHATRKRG